MNTLYYGDNLNILREHIADESIDLIYLDPPFNSKHVYNVYLKTPKGHSSEAQVTAFEDSWTWGEQAEREYNELLHQPNTDVSEMIASMRKFLNESADRAVCDLDPSNRRSALPRYGARRVELQEGKVGKRERPAEAV